MNHCNTPKGRMETIPTTEGDLVIEVNLDCSNWVAENAPQFGKLSELDMVLPAFYTYLLTPPEGDDVYDVKDALIAAFKAWGNA